MFSEVKGALQKYNLNMTKLTGVTTDGAPAMRGKNTGLTALLEAELRNSNIESDLIKTHCVIHQEQLCAKKLKMNHVMSVVITTVNYIRSRGLNHRQFKELLQDIEAEYGDVVYHCEVRWLSRAKVLQRFYFLHQEIKLFMEMKDKHIAELSSEEWLLDLAFLVDITAHLNDLGMKLMGKGQLVTNLLDHIKAFQMKRVVGKSIK